MADIPAIPSPPPPPPPGESGIDDNNSKTLSPKRDHGHSAHLRPKSKSRSRSRSCSSHSHQTRSRSRSHSRSPRVRSRSRSRSPRRNKHHNSHSHTRRHRSRDHDRESHSISGRRHPSSHHSYHSHHRRLSRSRSNSRSYTPEHHRSRSRSRSPRRVNNSPPSSSHHHHYHGDERHRRKISRSFSRSPSRGGHSSSRNGTNGSRRLLREELNGHGERNGGGPKIAMVRGVEPNIHHNGPHGIHHPPFGAGNQPPSGPKFREDEFHRGEPGHGGFRNSPPHFNGHPHPPRHDHYGYGGVLPPLDGSHANGNNGMHGPYGPGGYFGGAPPPQCEPSMRRNGGGRKRDEGLPGVSLLVRNISPDIRTEDLQHAFGKIGDVRDVYIPRDYHSQQPKGFAFVEFATHEQARDARNEMDNFTMKGRILEVVFAQERRKTPNEMRGRVIDGRENDRGHGARLGSFERSSSFERHKRREREANR